METASVYIPMDRRQALASGTAIPERTQGAALFADISGFTPLTEALALELGPKRGADELTHHLNVVYNALISELHRYGGSVINFSGDAITCWLDGDDGSRATACALGMQRAMQEFAAVTTHSGTTVSLGLKAAVATGPVRRFLVGDPAHCIIDVIAGSTLERLSAAEQVAEKAEVILDPAALASLGDKAVVSESRETDDGEPLAVVAGLSHEVSERPWRPLPAGSVSPERTCAWLLSPVYQRLQSGQGEFLAELRPAVALFLAFGGIDYDEDPEAADKLDVFVRQVERVLTRYEGSLLSLTIGDKGSYLYAAFGAPIAHEDDATRAASAAVELQALAAGLDFIDGVRIGIAQGRMRTGAYGSDTRRTYSVLGDGVNLSARLMSAAEPGQILVSDDVRAVAESGFAWEDLLPIVVKGKREPVGIAWLRGVKQRRGVRLLEPRYSLPMVGRNAELALIEQKLAMSAQGHGQIVGITAEAGMGKSRLAAEVIALAHRRGVVAYGDECQSYGTTTSYLVWRCIWRGIFGLDPQDPLEEQVQALELRLKQIDPRVLPRLPLLGAVLNLSIPDNDLTRSLDAKVRKSSLEALLVDCLRARAKEQPLLLLLENCHWLDPLSSDLIETIGRALVDVPVLMLLVYRPWEPHSANMPRVSQLPHFTEVQLAELGPQEAERLIALKLEQWMGCEAEAAPGFVERITHQAAGNPFYIEELLNYLQDRGIRPGDREPLAALDLPSTLYSLILSRMDQLAESQQTLMKVASVIGRSFRAAMVWGVYPQLGSIELVRAELQALNEQDLVLLDRPEPELSYLFKHVITQEVAYESLPYSTRAMLHEQIGRYIEATYHATLEQYVNLLAFHYEHSENTAKKREYLLKAAEAAQADYANAAAIDYYEKLLPLLPAEEKVPVLLQLGKVLELTGQWQMAGERYEQALALAEELGDLAWKAWSDAAMAELLRKQGQYSAATTWLERARDGFQALNDEAGVGQVLHIWGSLAAQQTDLETARARYEDSLAVRQKLKDQSNTAALLSNLGIVARIRGDHAEAQVLHEQALALRHELGDKWAIANSLINLGNVHLDRGDYGAARSQLEEAVALLREIGDRQAIANALHSLGSVTREQGDYLASRDCYRESLTVLWELRDTWLLAHLLEDIGGLAATQGQPERALQLAAAAAALRETIGAPLSTAYQEKLDRMLKPSRQMLGEAGAEKAMTQGRTKTLEQAIEYAFETLVGSDSVSKRGETG